MSWMKTSYLEEKSKKELIELCQSENKRCQFFEKQTKEHSESYDQKLKELEEAHALIGRTIHQLSKRWDIAPLTKHMEGLLK